MVAGNDFGIRYVGISRNRLKDRWRTCPAYDAMTMTRLARDQLFHSQCWKHIEREITAQLSTWYEVRAITGHSLGTLLQRIGPPLSAFTALGDDSEGIAAAVERWLCNKQSERLVPWNAAMTKGVMPL